MKNYKRSETRNSNDTVIINETAYVFLFVYNRAIITHRVTEIRLQLCTSTKKKKEENVQAKNYKKEEKKTESIGESEELRIRKATRKRNDAADIKTKNILINSWHNTVEQVSEYRKESKGKKTTLKGSRVACPVTVRPKSIEQTYSVYRALTIQGHAGYANKNNNNIGGSGASKLFISPRPRPDVPPRPVQRLQTGGVS